MFGVYKSSKKRSHLHSFSQHEEEAKQVTSQQDKTSIERKPKEEDKYNLYKQFEAWRKSKNSSVSFSKDQHDSFYNHNIKCKLVFAN